jgi:uncharacterized protein YqfA (UPF0365 family)
MHPNFLLFLFAIAAAGVAWRATPVLKAWVQSRRLGAAVPFFRILRLFFKNVPLDQVMEAHAAAVRAGVRVELNALAAHALAGGDTRAVVCAYVETLRAGTQVDFAYVCELELSEPEAARVAIL